MKANSRIESIERATQQTWQEWLQFMESIDAQSLTHHQIASKVLEVLMDKIDNPGWWAQSVTVAYEQYIGRRIPGQRPDGTFQTSVSKATQLNMPALMDHWAAFAAKDTAVQALIGAEPRVSGTQRRITWRAKAKDGSSLVIISEPKANGTASLVVQHMGLQTLELNEAARAHWAEIVARFLKQL
ncbi:MAG: hypothetical protein KIT46_00730 [Anaerolineales bacterium]|nr:hypothetical protein [Anaerolineales bacterium]MCW5854547.1 hypothetical protein [Anaerolineales bacterium]